MSLPRFAYIPQPVFPNQRDDEIIYVLSRKHSFEFVLYSILFFFLAILPFIFLLQGQEFFLSGGFDLVYVRDIMALSVMAYLLILSVIYLTLWLMHYYTLFIVTDERIVEITQKALFFREIHELTFEQIEDISSDTKGFLSMIFEAGDLEIQTAGSQRNFVIKRLSKPELIVEITHELSTQARQGVKIRDRLPELAVVGVINGNPISQSGKKPAIMNFEKNLKETSSRRYVSSRKPKNMRERFTRWWTDQTDPMLATFGGSKIRDSKDEDKSRRGDGEMIDL